MFKALADPTRRSLLDELFRQDGQTLGMLEERFAMSRFGVMKHLKVLEEAGLVVTRRRGREKLHFLNPVPIRLVHDRWVSKYSEPWVAGLSEIKERLESQMEKVYEIFIKTTPEQLWKAITDPEIRAKYNFGAAVNSDWTVGSPISVDVAAHGRPSGGGRGARVATRPAGWCTPWPRSGTTTSRPKASPGSPGRSSRWGTPATSPLTHDQMREGANAQIYGGWPMILSGLKTWMETGELLTTPGSLMYG